MGWIQTEKSKSLERTSNMHHVPKKSSIAPLCHGRLDATDSGKAQFEIVVPFESSCVVQAHMPCSSPRALSNSVLPPFFTSSTPSMAEPFSTFICLWPHLILHPNPATYSLNGMRIHLFHAAILKGGEYEPTNATIAILRHAAFLIGYTVGLSEADRNNAK